MSAEINNREYRKKVLKELIKQLHEGKTVDQVQGEFEAVFGNVSAQEIAAAEQALIREGFPVEEIQRLCDVHAAVFKGSIEEIHRPADPAAIPGHPVHTLKRENRALEILIEEMRTQVARLPESDAATALRENLRRLWEIDRHYLKKENLLFPYLEKYGITAPPKVMWGVDDEIREEIKALRQSFEAGTAAPAEFETVFGRILEMIFKEENILFPMLQEHLTADEWKEIADGSGELGYCLIDGVPVWSPAGPGLPPKEDLPPADGTVRLPTGVLKLEELVRMLDTLPFDITFVDKNDQVKYFSQGSERIFPRTKSIIGRKVSNCHPPASMKIVEDLVEDLRAGRKDHEDFWIRMKDNYILIRYFAVRDESGEYLGVVEVTQNIAPIQAIQGEKRLVDSEP